MKPRKRWRDPSLETPFHLSGKWAFWIGQIGDYARVVWQRSALKCGHHKHRAPKLILTNYCSPSSPPLWIGPSLSENELDIVWNRASSSLLNSDSLLFNFLDIIGLEIDQHAQQWPLHTFVTKRGAQARDKSRNNNRFRRWFQKTIPWVSIWKQFFTVD